MYWTTCTVLVADPEREFAFAVNGPGGTTVNTWRYRLAPGPDGTARRHGVLPAAAHPAERPVLAGGRALPAADQPQRDAGHPGADQGHRRNERRADYTGTAMTGVVVGSVPPAARGDADPVAGLDARGQHRAAPPVPDSSPAERAPAGPITHSW